MPLKTTAGRLLVSTDIPLSLTISSNCCCEPPCDCPEGTDCCPDLRQGNICCRPDKCCPTTGEFAPATCCDEDECCNPGLNEGEFVCGPCPCDEDGDCPEGQCCNEGTCGPCPCEESTDCAFGECCVDNECRCTCASIGGVEAMEGMTVTFEGKEFVVGAPGSSSSESIPCDPNDASDNGSWNAAHSTTADEQVLFQKLDCAEYCTEFGSFGLTIRQDRYVTIRCNSSQPGQCAYWEVQLVHNCYECAPELGPTVFNGLGRLWTAKVEMDENCLPSGEPYDLVLTTETVLGQNAGDCDPQPPSIFYGNPLP